MSIKKLLLLFIIPLFSFGQNSDLKKIKQVLFSQEKFWNDGDIDGFMLGYWNSKELQFSTKNGTTYGWKNTLKRYKKNYRTKEEMGQLKFQIINLNLTSDTTASLEGEWELIRLKDNPKGSFLLSFQKFKENWLIIKDITTVDKEL